MDTEKELQLQRFKIIEPFLRKEKKLKEIEEETGISYATLKRWVNGYKKNGILGLDKKQRTDKDSYRAIDEDGVEYIEQICRESKETKISKLYSFCKEKLSNKYNISYPTFYRIVSNLDGFFNKSSNFHMKKIKKENQVYLILEIPLYILVSEEESEHKIVPQLLISLDAATLKPINHALNYNTSSIYTLLSFIRESMLKVSYKSSKLIKPQEILVSSENINNKKILKEIYDNTSIKITEYFSENEEIKKFISFLEEDIEKFYYQNNKNLSYQNLKSFLDSYIYLDNQKYDFTLKYGMVENISNVREFDVFLQEASRKISKSSLRFNNFIYTNNFLTTLEGKKVIVKYNPLDTDILYLFFKNQFLGTANIITTG